MKPVYKKAIWTIAILFSISPILIYSIALYQLDFANTSDDFGIFGDYIGGTVGTILGFISVFLVYVTYMSQVSFARKQDEYIKRQQFETTFFCLLEQQQIIRSQLSGKIGDETYNGTSYIQRLKMELADAISELNYIQDEVREDNKIMLKNKVNQLYIDFFLPNGLNLGHYYRHLYHIVKYIDESCMINKKKYADLLQAQLSNDELYLLAFNGISNLGRKKMKPLIDEYGILENYNANNDMLVVKLLSIFYKRTKSKYLMFKNGRIVFVGGVHGVGKSTFAKTIKMNCPQVESLSCSTIIKWENPAHKKVDDVDKTQDVLLMNLPYFIDQDKNYILDGHFCLLTGNNGISRVPMEVFETISPSMIVLLEEDPNIICQRLNARDSQNYSLDLMAKFQKEEIKYATEVAETLGIPIEKYKSTNCENVIQKVLISFN